MPNCTLFETLFRLSALQFCFFLFFSGLVVPQSNVCFLVMKSCWKIAFSWNKRHFLIEIFWILFWSLIFNYRCFALEDSFLVQVNWNRVKSYIHILNLMLTGNSCKYLSFKDSLGDLVIRNMNLKTACNFTLHKSIVSALLILNCESVTMIIFIFQVKKTIQKFTSKNCPQTLH